MCPVCEQLLMMSKHVWPMLTQLCLLLVLHEWKAIAGGDNSQAAYAEKKIMLNLLQGVGTAELTA